MSSATLRKPSLPKENQCQETIGKINNRSRAGLSQLTNDVVFATKKLESFLRVQLSFNHHDNCVSLVLNNMCYKDPGPTIESLIQKKTLQSLINTPSQGPAWSSLNQTPSTTKQIYSFHTTMCVWRFVHAARLSLT